jgi:hypothetical protein
VFYRRLMSAVDDFGRFSADCKILRAKLYPLRVDEITCEHMLALCQQCADAKLIDLYEVEGKKYLFFRKLGTPRAKESRYPAPPAQADEIICAQTHASVPYSYSGANANASSDASSNAKRRGAMQRGALAPGGEPEPTVSRQEGPSRSGGIAPAEPVMASPSRKGRTAPTVSVSQAVTTEHVQAALASIRQHFPAADRELARSVAEVAVGEFPAITPAELGQIVGLAHRRHMRSPSLFLTTVPEEIKRRLIQA